MSATSVSAAHAARSARSLPPAASSAWLYSVLFFISGFPALLYQIVWQRSLFTLFGANIESVTIIVTIFMLGLGLGSLAGGRLSAFPGMRLLAAFGCIELGTGAFGMASLWLFHRVAAHTAGSSLPATAAVATALLLVPTLLMGSTLPLLSEHFVRCTGNVGESVGLLYCLNTLGSGIASLSAAWFLMRALGESGSVRLAVGLNLFAGSMALLLQMRRAPAARIGADEFPPEPETESLLPLPAAMLLAGATGFIALAWEIVWYRLYSFATGASATAFPILLGIYLLGIAYGALRVRDACARSLRHTRRRLLGFCAEVVLGGSMIAFLLGPALAALVVHFPLLPLLPVFISAALLGAAFPLLSHVAIDPRQNAGKSVSLLYLSNIVGCTAGSFLVGFILFDYLSTRVISVLLLFLGLGVALLLMRFAGHDARKTRLSAYVAAALLLVLASGPLFSHAFERLLFKRDYHPGMQFSDLVENRNGVIAVYTGTEDLGYTTSTVYGGGTFDGRFNTDPSHDSNGIFRMYAVAGMRPEAKHVLMIGLASGSWAQVAANMPALEDLTIVEINPGYLPLIRKHPEVQSLLHNPRVHIVIDDGRRWLLAHPDRFDLIVCNTTFNWRANTTNLLSVEFLQLIRAHLLPGGILYYNTTWSPRVMATGIAVYPYALRVEGFLAVGDSPIMLDKERWRALLSNYRIDGRPVIDPSDASQRNTLDQLLQLPDHLDVPEDGLESRASLARRLAGVRLVTDDNMGTEWDPNPQSLP
ncbi:MAG TPA: fused MFS/spermidine synthase [Acidobacteriaceae bacterium]|nr:fused MFS/spermidine synthase [Acidobacteriaceae bacterium]